jgi:hypothetical protein
MMILQLCCRRLSHPQQRSHVHVRVVLPTNTGSIFVSTNMDGTRFRGRIHDRCIVVESFTTHRIQRCDWLLSLCSHFQLFRRRPLLPIAATTSSSTAIFSRRLLVFQQQWQYSTTATTTTGSTTTTTTDNQTAKNTVHDGKHENTNAKKAATDPHRMNNIEDELKSAPDYTEYLRERNAKSFPPKDANIDIAQDCTTTIEQDRRAYLKTLFGKQKGGKRDTRHPYLTMATKELLQRAQDLADIDKYPVCSFYITVYDKRTAGYVVTVSDDGDYANRILKYLSIRRDVLGMKTWPDVDIAYKDLYMRLIREKYCMILKVESQNYEMYFLDPNMRRTAASRKSRTKTTESTTPPNNTATTTKKTTLRILKPPTTTTNSSNK